MNINANDEILNRMAILISILLSFFLNEKQVKTTAISVSKQQTPFIGM